MQGVGGSPASLSSEIEICPRQFIENGFWFMFIQHSLFPPITPAILLQEPESAEALGGLVTWYSPRLATVFPLVHVYTTYETMRKGTPVTEHMFIRYKLDEAEKEQFTGWSEMEKDEAINLVAQVVAAGNKFSIGFDAANGQFLATVSNSKPGDVNQRKSVTSRAPELAQAILVSCFKHLVIFGEIPWDNRSVTDDWG